MSDDKAQSQIEQETPAESTDPSIKDEKPGVPSDEDEPELQVPVLSPDPSQQLSKWRAITLLIAMGLSGINGVSHIHTFMRGGS
jgi:hypothetical protein